MRTTIDIPDALYQRLKTRAAREGRPAKALILRGLEALLQTDRGRTSRRVRLPLVRSKRPGSLRLHNARIYEVISFP